MVNQIDRTMLALADPTRRQVVETLRTGPRRAGEIAAAAGMSRPAMSRHLKVLRKCGLVDVDTHGEDARGRVYQLRPERFLELRAWLDDVQTFWSDQLESFREHVDREGKTGAE